MNKPDHCFIFLPSVNPHIRCLVVKSGIGMIIIIVIHHLFELIIKSTNDHPSIFQLLIVVRVVLINLSKALLENKGGVHHG